MNSKENVMNVNNVNFSKEEREAALKAEFVATVAAGGVPHEIWVSRYYGIPVVGMANEEDQEYVMWFASRERIDAFIQRLQAAADEAFGD